MAGEPKRARFSVHDIDTIIYALHSFERNSAVLGIEGSAAARETARVIGADCQSIISRLTPLVQPKGR